MGWPPSPGNSYDLGGKYRFKLVGGNGQDPCLEYSGRE
jgi:hypothetical protein